MSHRLRALSSAVIATSLMLGAGAARADGVVLPTLLLGGAAAGLGFGVLDLAATEPRSRAYDVAELATTGAFAVGNLALWSGVQHECSCSVFGVVAALDAALAIHGGYALATRMEPPALAFRLGALHGTVAPTALADGRSMAAGIGTIGRF